MTEDKIKVILADDHQLVREGFSLLLSKDPEIEIIGVVDNGKKLLELIKINEPHIVLMDMEMPVMTGSEALDIINRRFPKVLVIIVSFHDEMSVIAEYISKGAKAYITKCCSSETLIEAIHSVKDEGYYFTKSVSKAILQDYLKEKSINPEFSEVALSKRESEVLVELCDGKTNKQIASKLNIAAATVDFHRGRIYKKTKSKNLAGIVKYALKNGFVTD